MRTLYDLLILNEGHITRTLQSERCIHRDWIHRAQTVIISLSIDQQHLVR